MITIDLFAWGLNLYGQIDGSSGNVNRPKNITGSGIPGIDNYFNVNFWPR
jgi:hypothetical protein